MAKGGRKQRDPEKLQDRNYEGDGRKQLQECPGASKTATQHPK